MLRRGLPAAGTSPTPPAGQLSRETRKRDRGPVTAAEQEGLTGREIERQAVLDGGRPARAVPAAEPPARARASRRRDPRRHPAPVPQPEHRRRCSASASPGSAPRCSPSSGPRAPAASAPRSRSGPVNDVKQRVADANGFLYVPEGRMWVTEYPADALSKAQGVYSPSELAGMEAGLIALYQRCAHLGCRVPSCESSQWFECPCHGSRYNQVGEKRGGPAPRGMDRFAMAIEGGRSPPTPARSSRARRSASTPPARSPRDPPAWPGAAR